jgi:hypothetical protein
LKKGVIVLLVVLGFFALLAYMTLGMRKHRVEVCVTFQGRTNCATASGETRESAMRAAMDNACATISGGVTDSIACTKSTPDRVTWK